MSPDYQAGIRYALALIAPSQSGQAKALSVSIQTIHRWSNGLASPSPESLARIANKSGLDQETIREGGPDAFADTVDSINQADTGFRMASIPNR